MSARGSVEKSNSVLNGRTSPSHKDAFAGAFCANAQADSASTSGTPARVARFVPVDVETYIDPAAFKEDADKLPWVAHKGLIGRMAQFLNRPT